MMPTPGGLPRQGDRIQWVSPNTPATPGTVIERGRGQYWSLTVRWDGHQDQDRIVDASYWWDKGYIRFVTTAPLSPLSATEPIEQPPIPPDLKTTVMGDPGRTGQVFVLRLYLRGQWRSVKGLYHPEDGAVEVLGNGDLLIGTSTVDGLARAVKFGTSILLEEHGEEE